MACKVLHKDAACKTFLSTCLQILGGLQKQQKEVYNLFIHNEFKTFNSVSTGDKFSQFSSTPTILFCFVLRDNNKSDSLYYRAIKLISHREHELNALPVNPPHPDISMYILHTVLYTFL